jgi:putative ABC transport system permease protein
VSRLEDVTEDRMLCLTYLRHELRHRWWQALATATGLAVGVALVITVSAAASGTQAAQSRVLDSLDHAASSNAAAATVAGAVTTASGLAADLGTWVALAALIASFTVAALLTLASVTRRVREFGTLKALGWPTRRVTAQVLTETAVVGVAGTLAGVALGYAGTALASVLGPILTVNVTGFAGTSPSSTGPPKALGPDGPVAVHFSAPISPGIVALAVGLGILGTLLAGALGGWRAARLSPASALSRVG